MSVSQWQDGLRQGILVRGERRWFCNGEDQKRERRDSGFGVEMMERRGGGFEMEEERSGAGFRLEQERSGGGLRGEERKSGAGLGSIFLLFCVFWVKV